MLVSSMMKMQMERDADDVVVDDNDMFLFALLLLLWLPSRLLLPQELQPYAIYESLDILNNLVSTT